MLESTPFDAWRGKMFYPVRADDAAAIEPTSATAPTRNTTR